MALKYTQYSQECTPTKSGQSPDLRGGVEVFLRVFEAKTKKNAILLAPNVTGVPARTGHARKIMVFLIYGKVTPSSVTEYSFSSGSVGNGQKSTFGCLALCPAGVLCSSC